MRPKVAAIARWWFTSRAWGLLVGCRACARTFAAPMRRRVWIYASLLAMVVLLLGRLSGVWAQDYLFRVDRNISHVIVQRDGSADIEYWLTFTCAPKAHPIDVVDIGLPNDSYDLGSAQGWYVRGDRERPLDDIRKSEYLDTGIEVHLGRYAIAPGKQGTIHVKVNVKKMVYPDSQDKDYASVEFAPTYFGSQYVYGKTYMEIRFYFPPGVSEDETRYHEKRFDAVDRVGDRIVFLYIYPDATGSETHKHGISFPRKYVDTVYKSPMFLGTLVNVVMQWGCFVAVGLIIVLPLVANQYALRKRKMAYLPPTLAVEGVGIKRGLTAVEAAILLEMPLNRVLTMILFGLLKKKAVVVLDEDPLRLRVVESVPKSRLRYYEKSFLESIKPDGTLDEKSLQEGIVRLVKAVNKKLKGFSRKETVSYYRQIVNRAWDQVTAAETPEVRSRYFDRALEWVMLDDKFDDRARRAFGSGPVYLPSWWAYYRPWVPRVRAAQGTAGGGGGAAGGGKQVTLPTLPGATFASTVVGGIERTAGSIVSRLERFTGGVTAKTNPAALRSSGGSSYRSGGCACACACACAGCACACAGGGR